MRLVYCIGQYVNESLHVFFNLCVVGKSPAEISAHWRCFGIALSRKFALCNEVSRYGKKEAGTGEHLTYFNNKINKHK